MALPNPSMSFSPFAILTAEEMNDIVENIEALADVSAFNAGSFPITLLENGHDWTSYSANVVGFSALPSGATYRYFRIGNMCTVQVFMPNPGTSNSTSLTIDLPFQAANTIGAGQWMGLIPQTLNNGATNVTTPGIAVITGGATVITTYRDLNGALWTASGTKRVPHISITYECVP